MPVLEARSVRAAQMGCSPGMNVLHVVLRPI